MWAIRLRAPRLISRGLATTASAPKPSPSPSLHRPPVVRPTSHEVTSGRLDERNLEKAVRHVHQDGLVVIENVVPHNDIDLLNAKMVTSAVLGPRPKWTFCSANSAMPPLPGASPQRQPVHSDADFAHPSHPFALVVNVPLVTMTPDNGSTELWLGTHNTDISYQEGTHGERASGRIKEKHLRDREAVRPPIQPTVKKGSVVLRDLRLWHAGMPNPSDQVRIMLAMIHFAPWYRNPMRLQFGDDLKPVLEELDRRGQLGLDVPVDWVSSEEAMRTYLNRGFGNSYDFNQTP
ncbi:Kanamycin B dioxygenase [Trichoderma ghanense]|uniref:Kanamycin B dioxygenase n=1 Tax=Trichoderma ghanense TaxID=65468 RepID=A0ABY2H109_9HYPO